VSLCLKRGRIREVEEEAWGRIKNMDIKSLRHLLPAIIPSYDWRETENSKYIRSIVISEILGRLNKRLR